MAYGETLLALGGENPNIVALDADLCRSTMTSLFEQQYPERFFEMGIAEQNMMSVAAGLSLVGKIPFVSSFAVFAAGRTYDQFRQSVAVANLNVKVFGSSSGLSDFGDGATHQAIDDIAIMSAIPNVSVFVPADAVETAKIVRAMVMNPGPMYVRVCRNDLPVVTPEDDAEYRIGQVQTLRDGEDAVIFACGIMVRKALEAASCLAENGVNAKVVNVSTIKPLDEAAIQAAAKGMKGVVTAEEHNVIGGLGSAISRALRLQAQRIEYVGVNDLFGQCADGYDELLARYGLTVEAVVQAAERVVCVQ